MVRLTASDNMSDCFYQRKVTQGIAFDYLGVEQHVVQTEAPGIAVPMVQNEELTITGHLQNEIAE